MQCRSVGFLPVTYLVIFATKHWEVILGMNLSSEVGKKRRLAQDALVERVVMTASTSTFTQNDPREIFPRCWGGPSSISGTGKPFILFGGLVSRIEFLSKVGLAKNVKKAMPFKLFRPKVIPLPVTLSACHLVPRLASSMRGCSKAEA